MTEHEGLVERLTRPIIGIENRTALEAFDIMADRIRASLAAMEKREEWQPIETAPKDGTAILAAVRGRHSERPNEAPYYVTAARWLWSNDAREPHENYPHDGAFFELNNDWADAWGGNIGPTHWRPLPEPPTALQTKGGEADHCGIVQVNEADFTREGGEA